MHDGSHLAVGVDLLRGQVALSRCAPSGVRLDDLFSGQEGLEVGHRDAGATAGQVQSGVALNDARLHPTAVAVDSFADVATEVDLGNEVAKERGTPVGVTLCADGNGCGSCKTPKVLHWCSHDLPKKLGLP